MGKFPRVRMLDRTVADFRSLSFSIDSFNPRKFPRVRIHYLTIGWQYKPFPRVGHEQSKKF